METHATIRQHRHDSTRLETTTMEAGKVVSSLAAAEAEHQVEGGFLLYVVVRQGAAVLELLPGEDEPLLVRRDALLVLDLSLDVVDGVRALHLQCDRLPGESFDKYLHPSPESQHQMERRLLLDVVISKSAAVLELLPGEDEPLLVRRDALLVLDLSLDVVDGVRALHLQCDRLPGESFDKYLHPTPESQHQMERRLLLDVVISKSAAVLELLPGEDEPLLVRRDALLVLDLSLDVVDGVRALHLQCDRLPGESFDKYLHPSPESQHQMERRLLLDVVISKSAAVLELLPGEDEPLLVRRDALLVLDLSLDVVDSVRALHLQCDRLPGESFDKYLHPSPESQHQMERRLLLDVVISKSAAVLQLLAREDESLLVRRDALLVLNLGLDVVDSV
ncbi:unnamed protein product [Musa banksii]